MKRYGRFPARAADLLSLKRGDGRMGERVEVNLFRMISYSGLVHLIVLSSILFLFPEETEGYRINPDDIYVVKLVSLPLPEGKLPDRVGGYIPPPPEERGMVEPLLNEKERSRLEKEKEKEKEREKEAEEEERKRLEKEKEEILSRIKKQEILSRLRKELVAMGDGTSPPVGEGVTPGLAAGTYGTAYGTYDPVRAKYCNEVYLVIKENWSPPERIIKEGKGLLVLVDVVIDREGDIKNYRVVKSSGNINFDQYVKWAIEKTRRVPPPPEELMNEALKEGFLISFGRED